MPIGIIQLQVFTPLRTVRSLNPLTHRRPAFRLDVIEARESGPVDDGPVGPVLYEERDVSDIDRFAVNTLSSTMRRNCGSTTSRGD